MEYMYAFNIQVSSCLLLHVQSSYSIPFHCTLYRNLDMAGLWYDVLLINMDQCWNFTWLGDAMCQPCGRYIY